MPLSTTAPICVITAQDQEEIIGERYEVTSLNLSLQGSGMTVADNDVSAQRKQQQYSGTTEPLQGRGNGTLPPLSLVFILALFMFLYVGAEVGFGAWVAVVVLREDLVVEAGATLMARCGKGTNEYKTFPSCIHQHW